MAKICKIVMAGFYYTEWVQCPLVAMSNFARPNSPEFVSSVLLTLVPDNVVATTLAIIASTIVQTFALICLAQLWHILTGSFILFIFILSNAVTVKDNP